MNRAIFLDRDGVLDELVFYKSSGEWEAPRRLSDLQMIDVRASLQRLVDAGWLLFIVTNQPSHAKGKATRDDLETVHGEILRRLNGLITRSYVCFHQADDGCDCRKPSPRFLREAAQEFNIDLSQSWMVGDQDTDLACGRAAGTHVALVEHPRSANKRGAITPEVRGRNLDEVLAHLERTGV
ncbi:MAG: HAD family hydrolase [Acidobacteria bacterium]|nr:MAG: HAD family hydrolase [Acidobacteriota bacterium]